MVKGAIIMAGDYVMTPPTLPSNGLMSSPASTLEQALLQWSHRFAVLEATSEPKEYLTAPERIDNGWDKHGYYQNTVLVVDVRYRYTARGKWHSDRLMYNHGESFKWHREPRVE